MAVKKKVERYEYRPAAEGEKTEPASAGGVKKTPFAVVEAYKTLRTNLLFLLAQNDGKVLALSSAGANEGKSTTSVNVAIAFSQLGGKVLLIDGDMRRSSVHKKMKLENEDGISNVLAGFSTAEKAVQTFNENLDVMTAGPIPPNPSELLGSKKFQEFIAQSREKYDYIIVDTPPINVVADALVIAPQTDGLVLVVRDTVTPSDALRHAIDAAKFANINLLGLVMNGANSRSNRRYSYRKYSYGRRRLSYYNYSGYGGSGYGSGYGYGHKYGYGYGYGSRYGYGYGYGHRRPSESEKDSDKNKEQKKEK